MLSFDDLFNIKLKENMGIRNVTDDFLALILKQNFVETPANMLVVTATLHEATCIYNSLAKYLSNVCLFPMDDFLTVESLVISPTLMMERLRCLNQIALGEKTIVVTCLDGYLRYLPTVDKYKQSILTITKNTSLSREEILEKLQYLGYNRETIVSKIGEYGVRGYVIDIFSLMYDNPIRLEFFGDEIESIREFDINTQQSIKELEKVCIFPYTEFLIDDNSYEGEKRQKLLPELASSVTNIGQFLNTKFTIVKNYSDILTAYQLILEEVKEMGDTNISSYMWNLNAIIDHKAIYIDDVLDEELPSKVKITNLNIKAVPLFNDNYTEINKYLQNQIKGGKTVILAIKEQQAKRFTEFLTCSFVLSSKNQILLNQVNIIYEELNCGFIYLDYVVLTANELFNTKTLVYKQNIKNTNKIKDIAKLEIGDYVVHNAYGIGIYNGIKTLTKNSIVKDYIELLYANGDKLYVPVSKIDFLNKYCGKEGATPKINKLGGAEWFKSKQRVREKIRNLADKILKVQAERNFQKGFAFSKDTPMQLIFENEFEYELTPDQQKSVDQIKADMENIVPMDRILCGDVGYGKTEVAFRAMFKAVMNSKQVLYLCPTTLLSNQQYKSAIERFKNFPVNIALLNRFTSAKETQKILAQLQSGELDIVFGTHRILSDDIKPARLGLLVVDEEQRFGVMHKEKIKNYKTNVDVLTLTATPIPRTLQMAMLGIRNLSLIETPPKDRHPIQTYVIEESDSVIRNAVYKELSRNGQVYMLYNQVSDIEERATRLKRMLPNLRVAVAHGQMDKSLLEERMIAFINREYDVLLCTTIIETGIDIPNVNTLIIIDADKFGLSQLYQIRGRVGRSDRIAYAYLMYKKSKMLTTTAVKRLKVIKDFTELGSGFSIATRDLSIRGAGDILGSEQAGFIDTVGIELYIKMLNEEVAKLKGNTVEDEGEDLVEYNEKESIEVDTHIDNEYIEDTDLKIEIHKLISGINSQETFEKAKSIIEDRFGVLDEKVITYMYSKWFEVLVKAKDVIKVVQNDRYIELTFSMEKSETLNYEDLFIASLQISNNFKFRYVNKELNVAIYQMGLKEQPLVLLIRLLEKV